MVTADQKCEGLSQKPRGGWFVGGARTIPFEKETNQGPCACPQAFGVSDQYHWHDSKGICHNRVECK